MYLPAVVALYLSLEAFVSNPGHSRIRTYRHRRGVDGFSHWFDHHFSREHTILVFYDMIADFPIH